MIILIGGTGSVGKTLMAQRLLETYKIPYLSMDHLKMGLVRGLNKCPIRPRDNDGEITKFLWPILRGIIMTNIENNQSLIVEGCYLPFDFINDFSEHDRCYIISFFIVMTEGYISNNFNSVKKIEIL